jgi:hypothetical protein
MSDATVLIVIGFPIGLFIALLVIAYYVLNRLYMMHQTMWEISEKLTALMNRGAPPTGPGH